MAHEVEFFRGQSSMFSVKEVPWHGLGQVIGDAPSIAAGIQLAGLDWRAQTVPLITADDQQPVTHQLIRRDVDGKHLGCVGPSYVPLQNVDAFNWFQPWLDSGMATLETAGSLRGGTRIWVMAKIVMGGTSIPIVGNDVVDKYILLAHAHDGSLAIHAGFNPVRVVCMNTLRMALNLNAEGTRIKGREAQGSMIRLRHTKNAVAALGDLRETMNLANQTFEATAEHYRRLARHSFKDKDLRTYITKVMGYDTEEEMTPQGERLVERVTDLVFSSPGADMKEIQGTWWQAYNGVTAFLSHEDKKDADSRQNALWFGDNAKINDKALYLALEMIAA